jgi:hypothetical protein
MHTSVLAFRVLAPVVTCTDAVERSGMAFVERNV